MTQPAATPAAAAPSAAPVDEVRDAPAAGHRHLFANAEFDEAEGVLRVKGQVVDVEPRPLRLLVELLRRPNEVVTKDELFDSVWNGRATVDHVLANAVSKLRSALGEEAGARIVTVPRVGYRLNGPVQRLASAPVSKALLVGAPVPGREAFVLERALGEASRSEVWLARHARLGHVQVFKFAHDAAGLSALKREYTLYRVLQKELGPRDDFARVTETQFMSAPYFIEADYAGRSLLDWADEAGQLGAMPLRQRLALFLQVAKAVSAAHSVGVLHKDLKPGNVLVAGESGRWQVRLTDFGSGRLLQPERLAELKLTALGMTQAGELAAGGTSGTFMYMAPELLGGHAPTVQSDVHSLGVLLYQVLVGDLRRPLAPGWERGVGDELLVEEIASATDGSPERRTESVATLVERLQRLEERRAERMQHAADAALLAHAMADQIRRRARRPWVVAGMGGLAIGLLVSMAMYLRADSARKQALDARQQVQAVSDFLHQDVLESPDVLTSGGVRPVQLMDVMRRAAKTAAERFSGQPLAEATVRRKIAETYLRRSAVAEAIIELRKAEALLSRSLAPDADELLAVRFLLARCMIWGQQANALELLESSETLAGPVRLQAMTDLGAQASRARLEFLLDAGRGKEAVPLALRLVEQTDALFPAQSARRIDARQKLAETYVRSDLKAQAAAMFEELAKPPYNLRSMADEFRARELAVRAEKLVIRYQIDEAEPLVQEWYRLMTSADPPNPFSMAWAEMYKGDIHHFRGQFKQALQSYQASMPLFAESVGPEHVYIPAAQLRVAAAAQEAGHHEAALALYTTVDTWFREHANKAGHESAQFGRVQSLMDLGRAQEALDSLDRINMRNFAIFDVSPGSDAWVKAERGRILLALGRRSEGLALVRDAVPLLTRAGVPGWRVERYRRLL